MNIVDELLYTVTNDLGALALVTGVETGIVMSTDLPYLKTTP